jgi:nucleotide-binding universal stress UspA family protein
VNFDASTREEWNMWPPQVILHPTDFSECSDHAFRLACDLARLCQGRVIVLHAHYLPMVMAGNVPPSAVEVEDEEEATRRLNAIQTPYPEVLVQHRMVNGAAVGVILEQAEQAGADLIVMGTYGRRGISRLMLGSVADHVLRRAKCPVLTARPAAEGKPARPRKAAARRGAETAPVGADEVC